MKHIIVYRTTRPNDIKMPYEKMVDNEVEFGSPDKRSSGFLNSTLVAIFYVAVLAGLLHRFPVNFSQNKTGQKWLNTVKQSHLLTLQELMRLKRSWKRLWNFLGIQTGIQNLVLDLHVEFFWFCTRSLLRDTLDHSLIDRIPGRQNDRKTLLRELNWIFTAVTDTIAWNVLPHDLFQRLFRQDLLVASLFRNFLLAERIMRSTNCSPISHPMLPSTHQFVLLSQCHRFRALVLLGRFLDMGPWVVDLALSVGIFPYVLKLLQTTAVELRQILVFIWTKILAIDKSCQVDLVKDWGHAYFIKFLDNMDAYPEQRAMAAFVLAVIVDSHKRGQEACVKADLIHMCLKHLQPTNTHDAYSEPLLLQWLCLCLGKL